MITWTVLLLLFQILKCAFVTAEAGDPLENEYGVLKHASILFRHGDRGPTRSFPLDPYKNYPWPDGYGQLINAGKRRLVDVGKWFRTRYHNFVNSTYTRRETRVDSSDIDRCVMSAQCFLYGFYPATGEQIWLEYERWQPIPVYPIPAADDNRIQLSKKCRLLDRLMVKEAANPKYEIAYEKYKAVIEFIANETGIDMAFKSKANIFKEVAKLASTLRVYVQNNLTLPSWTKDIFPELLNAIVLETIGNITFSIERARLESGPFLGSVLMDMGRKITDEKDELKLHLYSGHDTSIKRVMTALKVYDYVPPAYGSSLIFELREKNLTNYVTVSHRNDTNESKARLLNVPGCGLVCTYEQFYNLTKPLIPENWDKECDSKSRAHKFTVNAVIAAVLIYLVYLLK